MIRRLSTRSGFDYKSPVLYMVNPVFITTRYGFIISRHIMEGVINASELGVLPLLQVQVGKPTNGFNITGMIYFIFLIQLWSLTRLCMGHCDPSGSKPLGQFFLCRHQDSMKSQSIIKYSKYHGGSTKSCLSATYQSILTSLLQGALRPKIMIVLYTKHSLWKLTRLPD